MDIEADRKPFVAFEDRHSGYEFPNDSLRSGALNEFVSGWHAALRSVAALAALKQIPKAWVRLRAGEIDWAEDCLYPHPSDYDEYVYDAEDEVTFAPVFIGTPPPAAPPPNPRDEKIQAYPTPEGYSEEGVFSEAAPGLSDDEREVISDLMDLVDLTPHQYRVVASAIALLAKVRP